jgi:hypothetical protein
MLERRAVWVGQTAQTYGEELRDPRACQPRASGYPGGDEAAALLDENLEHRKQTASRPEETTLVFKHPNLAAAALASLALIGVAWLFAATYG